MDVSYCGDMGELQVWRVSWFGELSQKARNNVNMASIEVGHRDAASCVFIGKWACSSAVRAAPNAFGVGHTRYAVLQCVSVRACSSAVRAGDS